MTETTTAATKAKTTKHATSPFGLPDYGMPKFDLPKFDLPKFDLPNMELPEAFREMTEKGVAQVRDSYAKAKVASEEAGELLESTYATVAKGATEYNRKLIEFARINTRAAFDYTQGLLGAKSPAEFIELATAHARKQFDIVAEQNKELCALAQETATAAAKPIKTSVSKVINKVA
jgi:phasin